VSVENLVQMFRAGVQTYGDGPMLRARRAGAWTWMTWTQVRRQVDDLASGVIDLGVQPGDRVALLCENRPEWVICDLAILTCAATTVGIYLTLTPKQIEYQLSDSGARAIIVSNREQLSKVLGVSDSLPELEHVILIGGQVQEPDADVLTLEEVLRRGRACDPQERERRVAMIEPGQLAALIYTSGTTGEPKGTMLTHDNFVSNCIATNQALPPMGPEDRNLNFLPFSHVFGRTGDYYLLIYAGVPITFAESWEKVLGDIREIRPTFMSAVPRFYEKAHAGIISVIERQRGLRLRLGRWSLRAARAAGAARRAAGGISAWMRIKRALADRLLLRRLRALAGGKIRFFVSGGGPLAKELAEFFYDLGMPVLEGYGLTETSPVTNVNPGDRVKPGTVGPAIPGVEIKIAEDGEILVRGPCVMKGYWNKPEATAEAIVDGWFHTGDVGHIDEDGYLVITDRKKDIIVSAGGKNIAPQLIENLLKSDPLIAETVVYGDRRKYLSALIVPAFAELEPLARNRGISFVARADLVANPAVQQLYREHIDSRLADLAPFEQVRKFTLLDHEFTQQDGHLTPSLKVKRRDVYRRYWDLLEAMYADE
jgi:long-chain acyl-CoA synthetase